MKLLAVLLLVLSAAKLVSAGEIWENSTCSSNFSEFDSVWFNFTWSNSSSPSFEEPKPQLSTDALAALISTGVVLVFVTFGVIAIIVKRLSAAAQRQKEPVFDFSSSSNLARRNSSSLVGYYSDNLVDDDDKSV